jgi:hypothetical protein
MQEGSAQCLRWMSWCTGAEEWQSSGSVSTCDFSVIIFGLQVLIPFLLRVELQCMRLLVLLAGLFAARQPHGSLLASFHFVRPTPRPAWLCCPPVCTTRVLVGLQVVASEEDRG